MLFLLKTWWCCYWRVLCFR